MRNELIKALYFAIANGEVGENPFDSEGDGMSQEEFIEKYFDKTDVGKYIDAEMDIGNVVVTRQMIAFEAGFNACLKLMIKS